MSYNEIKFRRLSFLSLRLDEFVKYCEEKLSILEYGQSDLACVYLLALKFWLRSNFGFALRKRRSKKKTYLQVCLLNIYT